MKKTITVLNLENIVLAAGSHPDRTNGLCVMEVVAWLAGERHSDHPVCVCPVLGAFLRSWNDSLDDQTRQRLRPYIQKTLNTSNDGLMMKRSWMIMDWLTRECVPEFMDGAGLKDHGDALRGLAEVVDTKTLKASTVVMQKAAAAAAAARYAAADAARYAAAYAAADAAARYAAAAARYAATYAAADAARYADAADAAERTLAPIVARVQDSGFRLLDRLVSLGETR